MLVVLVFLTAILEIAGCLKRLAFTTAPKKLSAFSSFAFSCANWGKVSLHSNPSTSVEPPVVAAENLIGTVAVLKTPKGGKLHL
jgi:hypothetical protein